MHTEHTDVYHFQEKFGIPMAKRASFLDQRTFEFRYKFLHEELSEFYQAHQSGDMEGAADALADLAYVLHGTALMMGVPWSAVWGEVQKCNMNKVRAMHEDESKRGSKLDVVKPAGWTGPDHSKHLGKGPWPTFNASGDDE